MPTSTFVFLDTNILFRVVTQGVEGCEIEKARELIRCVEDGTVTLLVPEVVVLELERQYRAFENAVAVNLAKVEKHLANQPEKEKIWNEVGDVSSYLTAKLKDWKTEKIEAAKKRHDEIQGLIRSDRTVRLTFDTEVWMRAKRRIWAGRVANPENRSEADCCILESLLRFFEEHGHAGQLLFCTENQKDFCVPLDGEKSAIHPMMREGLPPTEVFKNLTSLVEFIGSHKPVEEPAPEEVTEALERENAKQVEAEATLATDLSAIRAMQAAMPDLSAIRAVEMMTRSAIPEIANFSVAAEMAKRMAAMPDLSGFSAAAEMAKKMAAIPDFSGFSAATEMAKKMAAIPDFSGFSAATEMAKKMAAMPDLSGFSVAAEMAKKMAAMPDFSGFSVAAEMAKKMAAIPDFSGFSAAAEMAKKMAAIPEIANISAAAEMMRRSAIPEIARIHAATQEIMRAAMPGMAAIRAMQAAMPDSLESQAGGKSAAQPENAVKGGDADKTPVPHDDDRTASPGKA